MFQISPDVLLSSGRTITHKRLGDSCQDAIPTSGPDEMTAAEWTEYCDIIVQRSRQNAMADKRHTFVAVGC